MTLPSQELEAKVEAVEKNKVIIRILPARNASRSDAGGPAPRRSPEATERGPDQLIKIDRKFLNGDIQAGTPLKIEILTDEQASRRRVALGKAVLEEILNGGK